MKKMFVLGLLLLLSFGCIRVQSYVKPDVNFSTIKKVAIVKLGPQIAVKSESSIKSDVKSEKSAFEGSASVVNDFSQIITDAISMALMQRGFDVIQRSHLKDLVQNEQSDLTEAERKALVSSGIDAIIYGNVSIFPDSSGFLGLGQIIIFSKFSLSLKMMDARTGKLIWSANMLEADREEINKVAMKVIDTISPRREAGQ